MGQDNILYDIHRHGADVLINLSACIFAVLLISFTACIGSRMSKKDYNIL